MNWRVVLRPEVRADLAEAVAWYEGQRARLASHLAGGLKGWRDIATSPKYPDDFGE